MPRQTENIPDPPAAKRDDLKKNDTPIDLDNLFSLINTVVVTDQTLPDAGYVPDDPSDPNDPNKPDDPSEPNPSKPSDPGEPSKPDDPSEPDRSDELNASDSNPHTGLNARSVFWITVLALSLIAAVYPQRKRSKSKK